LNALVPIEPPAKTAFFTTGAEAVENAIKIAQAYTGRSGLIACVGGFHGRTALGMTLTGKVSPYKVSATSAVANVFHTPFPKSPSEVPAALLALDNILRADIDPKHVAAILVEPVQGEGGFHVAPEPFLAALRGVCTDHGIQLIADEIQTGFARTGKMFAMEHYGIKPDLMTLAKSLAGGLPLSAVCGRAVVMDALAPGGLGGTYAGNPLAIAASHAVLDVIESEKLCKRAEALGARMRACLLRAQDSSRRIAEVRGLGSMMAFEMKEPGAAKRVQAMAFEKGVLLLTCGMHGNAIRVLYPLTIGETSFAKVLDVLDEVFRELR
jgi:4-aminobutyrate aminotransferase